MAKKILYYIVKLFYLLEWLLTRGVACRQESTIVLLRMDNIGDLLLWLDAAKEFRNKYKDQKILLFCNSTSLPLAKLLPYWDEVISFKEKDLLTNPLYRIKFFFKLSKRKFLKIYACAYSHDYFLTDITVRNLKAKQKIGYDGDYLNIKAKLRGFLFKQKKIDELTKKLQAKAKNYYSSMVKGQEGEIMEIVRNADFVRGTINKNYLAKVADCEFQIPQNQENFGLKPKSYMVLFVGASTRNRVWTAQKYAQVIDKVEEKVVISGGKSDEGIYKQIESFISKKVVNLIGKTDMVGLLELIKGAKYVVSNDTSASHIAPIVKTPCVVLTPGTIVGRFHPYKVERDDKQEKIFLPKPVYHSMDCFGCHNLCKYVKDKQTCWPCIEGISVEEVLQQVNVILKNLELKK